MLDLTLATRLVETLPYGLDDLFNPWKDTSDDDLPQNTPGARLVRLAQHLAGVPEFILCGEAPGYQGCVRSGIAFTSERLLIEGVVPRVTKVEGRLTERKLPFSEPSATIVWNTLYKLGIAEKTVLWNAVQLHPYKPENRLSNRTPTPAEVAFGVPAVRLLAESFPKARIVAVGRKAEGLLTKMDIKVAGAVRHPANGGATEFVAGLAALRNTIGG
jgi:uracil-DNA glycosylase